MSMCKNSKISEYVWFCDITDVYNKIKTESKNDGRAQEEFIQFFRSLIPEKIGGFPFGIHDDVNGSKKQFYFNLSIKGNDFVTFDCKLTNWTIKYHFLCKNQLYLEIKTVMRDEIAFEFIRGVTSKFGGFYYDGEVEEIPKEVIK